TGGQGGALATPGILGAYMVASNRAFLLTGTYTVTSATQNIAAGCVTLPNSAALVGYNTVRGDLLAVGATTRPTIVASGISTFTLITGTGGSGAVIGSLILDGASLTSSRGYVTGSYGRAYNVLFKNFTNGACTGTGIALFSAATGCSTVQAFGLTTMIGCVGYSNTVTPFGAAAFIWCLAYNNSGASTDGFQIG